MKYTIKKEVLKTVKVAEQVEVELNIGDLCMAQSLPRGALYHVDCAGFRSLYVALGSGRSMPIANLDASGTPTLDAAGVPRDTPENPVVYVGHWPGGLPE